MSRQTEPNEQPANSSPEHLTFIEAAERLNISNDAVRMRVRRGKLASIQANNRTFVLWPQPETAEQANELRTERTGSVNRLVVQDDTRLVAALEDRITSLELQLAERTEEIRRRDVIINNLAESVRALPVGNVDHAPQEPIPAPLRDDQPAVAPEPMQEPSDRPWWRRLLGF